MGLARFIKGVYYPLNLAGICSRSVTPDTVHHNISESHASMHEAQLHHFLVFLLSINTSVLIPSAFD